MGQKNNVHTISIYCKKCRHHLYRYNKEGGGSLVKCFVSGITQDSTRGDLKCPDCGQEFARKAMIHGRPAHKIIVGKVYVIGNSGKK